MAHVTVRRLLSKRLKIAPSEVEIVRLPCHGCGGPHGRPAVPGGAVHFSLSHSGAWVAVALAETPVGVDVEEVPDAQTVRDIAPLLHPGETAELAALDAEERAEAFARCWTRKEAYLKATGAGLSEAPAKSYVGTGLRPASPPGWVTIDHELEPGYAAASTLRAPGTAHE